MHRTLIALAIAVSSTAAPGAAQSHADAGVAEEIARIIGTHPQLTIFDSVDGEVADGIVTLTGKVTADYKKSEVGRLVGRVDGVRQVRNRIAVLPASPFDDELRYRVSRAIYGNPAFWSYASTPKPPIHVIVEHGRVTLTGIVSSEVERALARSLATGNGELSVTNELRCENAAGSHAR